MACVRWFACYAIHERGLMPMPRTKTVVSCLLTSLLLVLTLPAWGADKNKDEETLRNANTVLQAMLASKDVPASVVAKADCVMVLPSVKKFAVGIGGTGGRGPMSCREGKDFSGKWSPPAMYSIGALVPVFSSAVRLPILSSSSCRRLLWTRCWTPR